MRDSSLEPRNAIPVGSTQRECGYRPQNNGQLLWSPRDERNSPPGQFVPISDATEPFAVEGKGQEHWQSSQKCENVGHHTQGDMASHSAPVGMQICPFVTPVPQFSDVKAMLAGTASYSGYGMDMSSFGGGYNAPMSYGGGTSLPPQGVGSLFANFQHHELTPVEAARVFAMAEEDDASKWRTEGPPVLGHDSQSAGAVSDSDYGGGGYDVPYGGDPLPAW